MLVKRLSPFLSPGSRANTESTTLLLSKINSDSLCFTYFLILNYFLIIILHYFLKSRTLILEGIAKSLACEAPKEQALLIGGMVVY